MCKCVPHMTFIFLTFSYLYFKFSAIDDIYLLLNVIANFQRCIKSLKTCNTSMEQEICLTF